MSNLRLHVKGHGNNWFQRHYDKEWKKEDLKFFCCICDKRFLTRGLRRVHKKAVHVKAITNSIKYEDNVKCRLCYEEFRTGGGYSKHKQKIHQDNFHDFEREISEYELKFECPLCKKKFISFPILQYHSITGHNASNASTYQNIFQCSLCYEKFKGKKTLMNHVESVHKDEQDSFMKSSHEYQCSYCELKCATMKSKSYHEKKQHPTSVKYLKNGRFTCPLCYCNYKSIWMLEKKHFVRQHQNDTDLLNRKIEDDELKFRLPVSFLFVSSPFVGMYPEFVL